MPLITTPDIRYTSCRGQLVTLTRSLVAHTTSTPETALPQPQEAIMSYALITLQNQASDRADDPRWSTASTGCEQTLSSLSTGCH